MKNSKTVGTQVEASCVVKYWLANPGSNASADEKQQISGAREVLRANEQLYFPK
jgi:hypothetical protein